MTQVEAVAEMLLRHYDGPGGLLDGKDLVACLTTAIKSGKISKFAIPSAFRWNEITQELVVRCGTLDAETSVNIVQEARFTAEGVRAARRIFRENLVRGANDNSQRTEQAQEELNPGDTGALDEFLGSFLTSST